MPFCPECRMEYRDGFTRCADCDRDLVESLPELPQINSRDNDDSFIWITNVDDGPLGESTLSILRAYDIPFKTVYSDLGLIAGMYTGRSLTGLDVYVPKNMVETAHALIQDATFDLSEAAAYVYQFGLESKEVVNQIRDIFDEYRRTSSIPVDEILSEPGENYVVQSQDMVFAVVRLTANGQFMIYPHPEHIETETFDAAFKEGIAVAIKKGVQTLWAEIPRDEVCFVAQYLKNGFLGKDEGNVRNLLGQEVEILKLIIHLQDMTE